MASLLSSPGNCKKLTFILELVGLNSVKLDINRIVRRKLNFRAKTSCSALTASRYPPPILNGLGYCFWATSHTRSHRSFVTTALVRRFTRYRNYPFARPKDTNSKLIKSDVYKLVCGVCKAFCEKTGKQSAWTFSSCGASPIRVGDVRMRSPPCIVVRLHRYSQRKFAS